MLFFGKKSLKILESVVCFVPKIEAWWKRKKYTYKLHSRTGDTTSGGYQIARSIVNAVSFVFADIEAKRHLHNKSEHKCPTCIWIAIVPKQHAKRDKDQQQVNKKIEEQKITNHTPKQHSTLTSFNRSNTI